MWNAHSPYSFASGFRSSASINDGKTDLIDLVAAALLIAFLCLSRPTRRSISHFKPRKINPWRPPSARYTKYCTSRSVQFMCLIFIYWLCCAIRTTFSELECPIADIAFEFHFIITIDQCNERKISLQLRCKRCRPFMLISFRHFGIKASFLRFLRACTCVLVLFYIYSDDNWSVTALLRVQQCRRNKIRKSVSLKRFRDSPHVVFVEFLFLALWNCISITWLFIWFNFGASEQRFVYLYSVHTEDVASN